MIDLDKVKEGDIVYLFRPKKGTYYKATISYLQDVSFPVAMRCKYHNGNKEAITKVLRTQMIEKLSLDEKNKHSIRKHKFSSNFYTFKSKTEMLVFINKFAYYLGNKNMILELDKHKKQNSIYYV